MTKEEIVAQIDFFTNNKDAVIHDHLVELENILHTLEPYKDGEMYIHVNKVLNKFISNPDTWYYAFLLQLQNCLLYEDE